MCGDGRVHAGLPKRGAANLRVCAHAGRAPRGLRGAGAGAHGRAGRGAGAVRLQRGAFRPAVSGDGVPAAGGAGGGMGAEDVGHPGALPAAARVHVFAEHAVRGERGAGEVVEWDGGCVHGTAARVAATAGVLRRRRADPV